MSLLEKAIQIDPDPTDVHAVRAHRGAGWLDQVRSDWYSGRYLVYETEQRWPHRCVLGQLVAALRPEATRWGYYAVVRHPDPIYRTVLDPGLDGRRWIKETFGLDEPMFTQLAIVQGFTLPKRLCDDLDAWRALDEAWHAEIGLRRLRHAEVDV